MLMVYCAGGSLTSTPFWMRGVTIMKMMRRTSRTSQRGTTFGSDRTFSLPPMDTENPIISLSLSPAPQARPEPWSSAGFAGLDEEIDDLRGGVLHLRVIDLDPGVQRVEDPQGQDRDADADGRRDEGLGDAAGDRADAARAGQLHAAERVDDAEDRAEQPDEGGRGGDRGQDRQAA